MSRGNLLRVPDYKTTGTAAWFVDPAGSDSNNCTSATSPCLTLLGVQAKMPKVVRNPVTITMADGNYAGGWFGSFQFAPTDPAVGAYIYFLSNGLIAFSPATGTATGTASSGTQCSYASPPTVFAALTDALQTWTVDNLRGQLIELTGGTGSGQFMPIISNTATVVTVPGCWSVAPDATTTYAIRDWGVVINVGTNQPPDPFIAAGSATGLGLMNAHDSERNNLSAFYFVDSIRVSTSGSGSAMRVANADVYARRSRFDSASSSGSGVNVVGSGRTILQSCVVTNSANGNALNTGGPSGSPAAASATASVRTINAYFQAAGTTTNPGVFISGPVDFNGTAIRMTSAAAPFAVRFVGNIAGGIFLQTSVFCTAGGSTVGLSALNAQQSQSSVGSNTVSILWDSSSISECATAIRFDGRMQSIQTDDSTFQATAGTTAIYAGSGAYVNLDINSAISGSFTTQISLDGLVTADFADVPSARAISVPDTKTTVLSIQ